MLGFSNTTTSNDVSERQGSLLHAGNAIPFTT